jgi:putative acetyltransferase
MITIRAEEAADILAIRKVAEQAFGQPQKANLIHRLRESCDGLESLVAESAGQVVGQILFSPVTIEPQEGVINGMGLGPLAVLPQYQRRGIGSRLVTHGLAALRLASCLLVIVLGDPEYYTRFGFEPAANYGISSQWEAFPLRLL